MKAIAYQQPLPIEHPDALQDIALTRPNPRGHDLLVEVKAVSVNPVDTKIRRGTSPSAGEWKVLGWDAAGVVVEVGEGVRNFKPGDRVWYAGSISRQGTNAEFHLVDEGIVGHMPKSLDFARAAALPLTAITAWEMLFDRLAIAPGKQPTQDALLVVGAAGGVGSILVQLARRLTSLRVIGTASRPDTAEWVRELGAQDVIDHRQPLSLELKRIGVSSVKYAVSLNQTKSHFAEIVESLGPQGKFGLIDDPDALDIMMLKRKSISLHWEFMFTRSLFETADMAGQGRLLDELAGLVDAGLVRTTVAEHFGQINSDNLKRAHALLESGRSRGKVVLEGF